MNVPMDVSLDSPTASYVIEDSISGIRAIIPAYRDWPSMLERYPLLAVWAEGEAYGISNLFHVSFGLFGLEFKPSADGAVVGYGPIAFLLWTLAGLAVMIAILWQLLGREVIGVEAGDLIHRLELFGIGRTRTFAGYEVRGLRAMDGASGVRARRGKAPQGTVVFEHGGRTYRLGRSLAVVDAWRLIAQMKRRLPEGAFAA